MTSIERRAASTLPTAFGDFVAYGYHDPVDGREHVALVVGDVAATSDVLVRVHSECLTGDVFSSYRCDCGPQLHRALELVAVEGCGVVVYLCGHEGRGVGLVAKLRAYELQEAGLDTVDANRHLGLPVDARDYRAGAQILADLGIARVRLLTNNPAKARGLAEYGVQVVEQVPLVVPATTHNRDYLRTKATRLGHLL